MPKANFEEFPVWVFLTSLIPLVVLYKRKLYNNDINERLQ